MPRASASADKRLTLQKPPLEVIPIPYQKPPFIQNLDRVKNAKFADEEKFSNAKLQQSIFSKLDAILGQV